MILYYNKTSHLYIQVRHIAYEIGAKRRSFILHYQVLAFTNIKNNEKTIR